MTIEGITFDLMRVTPSDDSLVYNHVAGNLNRIIDTGDKLKITTTGLNAYIATGAAMVCGRLVRITSQERVTIPANSSGYICITIDLTQVNSFIGTPGSTNYVPINNQVRVEQVKELVQQDIQGNGKIYTFPLASFTSSGSTVNITQSALVGIDTGWIRMGFGGSVKENQPIYIRRMGDVVTFKGSCNIPRTANTLIMAIPREIGWPGTEHRVEPSIQDSNNTHKCLLRIDTDGGIRIVFNSTDSGEMFMNTIQYFIG